MLSYHADADINTNPYELGLDRLVNLDTEINFIGKQALKKIKEEGVKRKQVGLEIEAGNFTPNKEVNHTHEGSIGNLCTENIKAKMDENFAKIDSSKIDKAIENLLA